MANVHYDVSPAALSHQLGTNVSLVDRIGGLFRKITELRAMRTAELDLIALDDRMLADIGIDRGDIRSRVWGGR